MVQIVHLLGLVSVAAMASAHGAITAVAGANGATGAGFGIVSTTPRDKSTKASGAEADTSFVCPFFSFVFGALILPLLTTCLFISFRVFKPGSGACGKTADGGETCAPHFRSRVVIPLSLPQA